MNYFVLKIIALITMTIDHVGFLLLDDNVICRLIGRLSFPLYCLLLVNGFVHTKDRNKYLTRLFIFSIISEIPFDLVFNKGDVWSGQNVFFTLTLGFLLMMIFDKLKNTLLVNKTTKNKIIFLSISLTLIIGVSIFNKFINADYGWYGIILICIFYFTYGTKNINKICMMIGLCFVNLLYFYITKGSFQLITILDAVFIIYFIDKKVYINKAIKYFCYIYYPLHLLIIYFLNILFFAK